MVGHARLDEVTERVLLVFCLEVQEPPRREQALDPRIAVAVGVLHRAHQIEDVFEASRQFS